MIETICDRDTCGDAACIGIDSSANIVLPSSNEFVTNILHLKCKVIELARRQMQKKIPGLEESSHLRSARRTAAMRIRQSPSEDTIGSPLHNGKVLPPNQNKPLEEEKGILANLPERPRENVVASGLENLRVADRMGNAGAQTEVEPNTFIHRLKSILSSCLPFYWIVVAIGILGFTSLVCGVLLGAFICTNGSNGFPLFFWTQTRIHHALY